MSQSVLRRTQPMTILPCAFSHETCSSHNLGHNQPRCTPKHSTLLNVTKLFERVFLCGKPRKTRSCTLFSLPVEILYELGTYLSDYERISLSLTCKALRFTFGNALLDSSKSLNTVELIKLLAALQRDIPQYRLCVPCQVLHGPKSSNLEHSTTKSHRALSTAAIIDQAVFYILEPQDSGQKRRLVLYWLGDEHIQRALTSQICLSTLRCYGQILMRHQFSSDATFTFKVLPVLHRGDLLFNTCYEIKLPVAPAINEWTLGYTKHVLRFFDIRCCKHCSTEQMLDEMMCFLYHGHRSGIEICVRAERHGRLYGEGCGQHSHECDCVTEYSIESLASTSGVLGHHLRTPVGVKIFVWQWFGRRADNAALRQKGVLRNLFEDAMAAEAWNSSST